MRRALLGAPGFGVWAAILSVLVLAVAPRAQAEAQGRFAGRVVDGAGLPVVGARVTLGHGEPSHEVTVFSDADGRYRTPDLPAGAGFSARARRIGWRDARSTGHRLQGDTTRLDLVLERETDPAQLAAQLPSNRWYALVLEGLSDPAEREELVRQCTYCHQQGSAATRVRRDEAQWEKVLALMARMGGLLSPELRAKVPELFNAAYDPSRAVPALTARMDEPDFAPPPPPRVRRAVIEEWELGPRNGMQHDVVFHPDGRLYSVDMMQDKLYRLDPLPGGEREVFDIPAGGLPLGGVFGTRGGAPLPPNANAHVGPHSLQVAPDGAVWTTLALGNQLARFEPAAGTWTFHPQDTGFYPHTLRFDGRGRIWYTLAASNHLSMFDPVSGDRHTLRLPAPSLGAAMVSRLLPAILWLGRNVVDISSLADQGGGPTLPVPYGVDVAPDGSVWFSQLNAHRIGRIDPDTFAVEMIDTPFPGPRRLRFDSQGGLWIPSFSSGSVSRFDPATRKFRTWPLPIAPAGSETPYALHVDRSSDTVWICGTNSDSLIRFEPRTERFTVYPLPTRVTFTREIDFDEQGRVWTSNSNLPAWQIEGGIPRVIRLDPGAPGTALARAQEE